MEGVGTGGGGAGGGRFWAAKGCRARGRRTPTLASRKAIERERRAAMMDSMGKGLIDNPAVADAALAYLDVHNIPFCARICPYCAFYKERADPAQAARFCEAIVHELSVAVAEQTFSSGDDLFWRRNADRPYNGAIGYPARRIPRPTRFIRTAGVDDGKANPGSVSERKARLLHEYGVNRVSLGVQSFDDALLQLLGREHCGRKPRRHSTYCAGADSKI